MLPETNLESELGSILFIFTKKKRYLVISHQHIKTSPRHIPQL